MDSYIYMSYALSLYRVSVSISGISDPKGNRTGLLGKSEKRNSERTSANVYAYEGFVVWGPMDREDRIATCRLALLRLLLTSALSQRSGHTYVE